MNIIRNHRFKNIYMIIGALVITAVLISGCGGKANSAPAKEVIPRTINVAAASSFQEVFQVIAKNFITDNGIEINFTFGSSGLLARQIEEGAPVDVYASASKKHVKDLDRQGLIGDEQSITATGQLVLIFSEYTEKTLFDLVNKDIEKIAIPNPEHAPYGEAAKDLLINAGLWDNVEDKIVFGNNVVQTTQFVTSGNADAGFVSLSQAAPIGLEFEIIDQDLYDPIEQPIVVIKDSANNDAAKEFISYLTDGRGNQLLKAYGFGVK